METKKLNYSVKFIKDSDWWLTKGYEFAVINQENGAVYQGWITFKEMVYGSDDEGNHLYRCTWVSSCQKNENLSIHDESGSEILNDRSFCN
ncbi:MAG TPA: hypothetical protein PKC28_16140 [Bdellovibrionales bacterium]|nr:hypothetical protein [Bdellovibrionales bacterium]